MGIQVATSGQYLLFVSGLRLGRLRVGLEATAGVQEADVTGICEGKAKEEGVISFFSHSPSTPSLPASTIAKTQNNSKLPQKA